MHHTFDLSYLQVGCGGSYLHPPQDDILLLGGYGGCILLRMKSVPELILMNYVHTLNTKRLHCFEFEQWLEAAECACVVDGPLTSLEWHSWNSTDRQVAIASRRQRVYI